MYQISGLLLKNCDWELPDIHTDIDILGCIWCPWIFYLPIFFIPFFLVVRLYMNKIPTKKRSQSVNIFMAHILIFKMAAMHLYEKGDYSIIPLIIVLHFCFHSQVFGVKEFNGAIYFFVEAQRGIKMALEGFQLEK